MYKRHPQIKIYLKIFFLQPWLQALSLYQPDTTTSLNDARQAPLRAPHQAPRLLGVEPTSSSMRREIGIRSRSRQQVRKDTFKITRFYSLLGF